MWNYELNLTFRRQMALTIATATTSEPYLPETIRM